MSVASDSGVRSALEAAAVGVGLQVEQALDGAAVSGLAGPFVTRVVMGGDGGVVACVAVRDAEGAGSDEVCEALTRAVGDGNRGREAEAVASGADLVSRFAGPFEAVSLSDGVGIQAVILTAVERRAGSATAHDPGPYASALSNDHLAGFDKLVNVALDVSVELGRTRVTLSEVLEYDVGSVVELDRAAGAPVDIRVNGTLLAQGEVVLIDDEYAVRITAIVDPGTPG